MAVAAAGSSSAQQQHLDPSQIKKLLGPPSSSAAQHAAKEYVSRHFPAPSKAALSKAASSSKVSLPSSSEIASHIAQLTGQAERADADLESSTAALRRTLLGSLQSVSTLRSHLSALPDQIADTEDELLDLCESLVGAHYRSAAAAGSGSGDSSGGGRTLMQELEHKQATLQHLQRAQAYFTILTHAEEQRRLTLAAPTTALALDALAELCKLTSLVEETGKSVGGGAVPLDMVRFVKTQRDRTWEQLRDRRLNALRESLEELGWPTKSGGALLSSGSGEKTTRFRHAWADICALQLRAEKLALMPISAASGAATTPTLKDVRTQPGTDEYVPLLAMRALVEPLVLRFRYHFDGKRGTNRLDKPEWYMTHVLNLLHTHARLFARGSSGEVARLCASHGFPRANPRTELVHLLLQPLRRKLRASVPLLLPHPALLAHTIFQALVFDASLREEYGVGPLADEILRNEAWFEAWLDGERRFTETRYDELLNASDAWAIDDEPTAEGEGELRPTHSAQRLRDLLAQVTERYRPLPALEQRLAFLGSIQLPLLRAYAGRIAASLDAFESLSGAFARAIPGAMSGGDASGVNAGTGGGADMVRGTRGLGRLVKALASARWMESALTEWSEQSFFIEFSDDVRARPELGALLRNTAGRAEDAELDNASLGALLRRGLKRSARAPTTAAATPAAVRGGADQSSVFDELRERFAEVADRTQKLMEHLIVGEVLEQMRVYSQRRWDEPESTEEGTTTDAEDIPTRSLLPALSVFSSQLSHLPTLLPPSTTVPLYRHVSTSLSSALVERVVFAGGAHRFDRRGSQRFADDLVHGWLAVVAEVAGSATVSSSSSRRAAPFGRRPEAPWRRVRDAATLLNLPTSAEISSTGEDGDSQVGNLGNGNKEASGKVWTLSAAVRAAWDDDEEENADTTAGRSWRDLVEEIGIVMERAEAREVLRRRVECWR